MNNVATPKTIIFYPERNNRYSIIYISTLKNAIGKLQDSKNNVKVHFVLNTNFQPLAKLGFKLRATLLPTAKAARTFESI